jgi:hypothetical protein
MLKFSSGDQKKKTKAILALEVRLQTLSTRFENHEINRKQYLEELSFFLPSCGALYAFYFV